MGSAFVDASKALERHDDIALLEALLEAWRKHRMVEIADAIDVVSMRAPNELATLLAEPWPKMWAKAKPHVAKLAALEPDPRVAAAFVRLLEEMPWTSVESAVVYTTIVSALAKIGDVRGAEKLRELSTKPNKHYDHEALEKKLKRAASAAAKFEVVPLGGKDAATWGEIESALLGSKDKRRTESKTKDDFVNEIYANPDDESLRRVYADWLSERNDPLGEFIVLQCERAEGRSNKVSLKREKELLEKHRAKWLGPIAGVVGKDGATFERGFLTRVDLKLHGEKALKSVIGDARWNTVRSVSFGLIGYLLYAYRQDIATFVCDDTTRALRFVQGAEGSSIVKAIEGRVFPWEGLNLTDPSEFCADPSLFDALPNLKHLGISYVAAERLRPIIDAPIFDRIEVLSTGYSGVTIDEWLTILARRPGQKLRAVRLYDSPEPKLLDIKVPITLRRDEQGSWTHLVLEGRARPSALSYFAESIEYTLERAKGIKRVDVEITRAVTDAHKAPVEAYAKKKKLELRFV